MTAKLTYLRKEVYLIQNITAIIGYIIVGFIILVLFKVTGIGAIAGATFLRPRDRFSPTANII
ncbi:MAG: hypothetical protein QW186_03035 [Candidatus Bathyarchaeia archaeon]